MKELNRVLENLECFSRSMGNPITLVEASAYIRRLSAATPEPDANLLSSRLRPNIECAPWVIESVKRLEQLLAASAQQGGGAAVCNWRREDPETDYYRTECGSYFALNDGTPADNNMRHCCYCGKPLVGREWEPDDEDELADAQGSK